MKRILVLPILCLMTLFPRSALCDSVLMGQIGTGYDIPRIFQDSQTSTYAGLTYKAKLIYRLNTEGFSIAPVFSFQQGKYQNGANSNTQTETLNDKTMSIALRTYFGSGFFQVQHAWLRLKDSARGATHLDIYDRSNGWGAGVGYEINLSKYLKVELSSEITSHRFRASTGGFSSQTHYLRYGAYLGISFVVPSSAPESRFELDDL